MARVLRRGDIVCAKFDPVRGSERAGRWPVVIISDDILNQHSGTVISIALTSKPQRAGFPLVYELSQKPDGKRAWAKLGQIRVLSVERLGKVIGSVEKAEIETMLDGLDELLGR